MGAKYFCDANDMALGRGLAMLRRDVVFPTHPDLPGVVTDTKDVDWIREVADRRLLVITRDKRMAKRPLERRAWAENSLRGFVLTGTGQQSTWESAKVLVRHWEFMEATAIERPTGPWMYALTKGPPREFDLTVSTTG